MKLEKARKLAERIVEKLRPACERIEIAGSIRRQRPEVNDIDLVILTRDWLQVRQLASEHAAVVADGRLNLILRLANSFQLDLFFAHGEQPDLFGSTPTNFGSLLLCRTGSKEHNVWFAARAKRQGLHWQPYEGLARCLSTVQTAEGGQETNLGPVVASATEADLYTALGLPFIPPEQREIGWLVEHFGK